MSQASIYGDEGQSATNYPLVRITNVSSHHVSYSRTHDRSSMAVASDDEVSTHFEVPVSQEPGLSKLEVVANGIASEPLVVVVSTLRFAVDKLPHLRNHDRSFADRGCNALDRACAHVTHREDAGQRGGEGRGCRTSS
jgi:hypothetical protein